MSNLPTEAKVTDSDIAWLLAQFAGKQEYLPERTYKALRELQRRRCAPEPRDDEARKIAVRDLHYTLVESYGLKDDPVSNHIIRKGLCRLAGLPPTKAAPVEPRDQQPFAWVMPGDDHANVNGWLDCRISSEGEFTKPLYEHPAPVARVDAAALNRELCKQEGHVLGVVARPCLRCHEWFDPQYGRNMNTRCAATLPADPPMDCQAPDCACSHPTKGDDEFSGHSHFGEPTIRKEGDR